MTEATLSISVIGAGSFGTAVAVALARNGWPVLIYCRTDEQAQLLRETGENRRYFPGYKLPALLSYSNDLDPALACDIIFLAFPAKMMEYYADAIAQRARPGTIIVNLVKGLHETQFTFAALYRSKAPALRYVSLKGPTFARPLLLAEWSGLTCGTADAEAKEVIGKLFANSSIVLDHCASADAIDLVSALKNIYAIVLGLVGSTGASDNTTYLFVTLVLKEVARIIEHIGYDRDALLSFAGLGDTLLTGLCDTSRNRTVGLMMGKGIPIDTSKSDFLAEGVRSVQIIRSHIGDIETPLLDVVAAVLADEAPPASIFEALIR